MSRVRWKSFWTGLTITTLEQWFVAEKLRENATNTPHVDSLGVGLEGEHDFRCSIPSCGHILCHESRSAVRESSRQTEVTDLELTVCIY